MWRFWTAEWLPAEGIIALPRDAGSPLIGAQAVVCVASIVFPPDHLGHSVPRRVSTTVSPTE